MFPIKCKDLLPVDHILIKSVSVRGRLGPLTVWVSNKDANCPPRRLSRRNTRNVLGRHERNVFESDKDHRIPLNPYSWTKLYDRKHDPCERGRYTELVLDKPVRLERGEIRAFYIHSTLEGDQAIVYDNSYYGSSGKRLEDDKICILTGRAHISTSCFGQNPLWGWGNAWRDRREFVGKIAYGTVYKLWNPQLQPSFGTKFQNGSRALFLCQRRWESPLSLLPDEAVMYILNMCPWDWFDDNEKSMKERRKRQKTREDLHWRKQQKLEQEQMEHEKEQKKQKKLSSATTELEDDREDTQPSAKRNSCTRHNPDQSCVARNAAKAGGKTSGLNDSDEEDEDVEDSDEEYRDVEVGKDADSGDDDSGDDDSGDDESAEMETEFDDSSSEEDEYHPANRRHFSFHYSDSDDEEKEDTEESEMRLRRSDWYRHQFARHRVLLALGLLDDQATNHFVEDNS